MKIASVVSGVVVLSATSAMNRFHVELAWHDERVSAHVVLSSTAAMSRGSCQSEKDVGNSSRTRQRTAIPVKGINGKGTEEGERKQLKDWHPHDEGILAKDGDNRKNCNIGD